MDYGFSFDSKKIAMGPSFFNLRIICDCLGKAIRRHIDYSEGELWFLDDKLDLKRQRRRTAAQDITESGKSADTVNTAFTYNFDDNLKIKTIKTKQNESPDGSDDDLSRSIG